MFVIGGYVMGILILEVVYCLIGIFEYMYYVVVISFGFLVGVVFIIGLIILMYCCVIVKCIIVMSIKGDYIVFILLFIVMLVGFFLIFLNIDLKGFDYCIIIGFWF